MSLARTFATFLVLFIACGSIAEAQSFPPVHAIATAIETEIARCSSDDCVDWHKRAYTSLVTAVSEQRKMELLRRDIMELPDNTDLLAQVDELISDYQGQQAKLIELLSDPARPQ